MEKKLSEKLFKLRNFCPTSSESYKQLALQILDTLKEVHSTYTLEELNDYVFFAEVPQRKLSLFRYETFLWDTVHSHWQYNSKSCELAELLIQLFPQKPLPGS
jgi:hypothetical protein